MSKLSQSCKIMRLILSDFFLLFTSEMSQQFQYFVAFHPSVLTDWNLFVQSADFKMISRTAATRGQANPDRRQAKGRRVGTDGKFCLKRFLDKNTKGIINQTWCGAPPRTRGAQTGKRWQVPGPARQRW